MTSGHKELLTKDEDTGTTHFAQSHEYVVIGYKYYKHIFFLVLNTSYFIKILNSPVKVQDHLKWFFSIKVPNE